MTRKLSPIEASNFTLVIYEINSGAVRRLKAFLFNKVFALGAGQFKGDLFLIFRGTTKANNNADNERTISI